MRLTKEEAEQILAIGDAATLLKLQEYLVYRYYAFTPRPDNPTEFDQQQSFIEDKFPGIACAIGGNASGKSEGGACKVARFLFDNPAPDDLCKFLIVSETIEQAAGLWVEKLKYYFKEEHIQKIEWQSAAQELPRNVIFQPSKNGNRWQLIFRSYQQGRKTFAGFSKVAGFWCDEPVPMDLLNELWTRCREYSLPGNKFLTLTPIDPFPELEAIFHSPADFPDWKFYRLNAESNYKFGGIKDISWLENTPDDLKETRRIGAFGNISGAIFKEFGKAHTFKWDELPDGKLPRNCEYYRVIDFAYEHETAVIWAARDLEGRWYIYHEWGEKELLIRDKVDRIKAAVEWKDNDIHYHTYADPEDLQQRQEFAALGIPSTIARKEPVTWSIELVRRAMMKREDGRPGLLISEDCEELIRQIRKYRWQKGAKRSLNPKPSPTKPVKEDDDYVDCLRMLIYSTTNGEVKPWDVVKEPSTKTLFPWRTPRT